MFDKLNFDLTYGAARYITMKELDTLGPIGTLFIAYHHELPTKYMQLCEFIDTYIDMTPDQYPDIPIDIPFLLDDNEGYPILEGMNVSLPHYILLYSEYDWNTFISGYLKVFNTLAEVCAKLLSHYNSPDRQEITDQCIARIDHIIDSLDSTLKLCTIGASYEDLVKAGNTIMQEMKQWSQSKPSAIRLSHAYLNAIGFYDEECPQEERD